MKVRDPHGRRWRVTRRWVPWRIRRRNLEPDIMLDGADDPVSLLVVLLLGLILIPLLSIVVIFALEALLLLALVPITALVRVAFGRHWWIEAREGFRPRWEAEAGTWRTSGERIREVAGDIERGDLPERTLGRARHGA